MKKLLLGSILLLASLMNLITTGCKMPSSTVEKYNGKLTPPNIIQVYGHRGARGLSPEQTVPAYNTALRLGVDYVDMDINMTKDGVLVVTHDLPLNPDITRLAGQWITPTPLTYIHNLTLSELKKYDVGKIKPNTEYAKLFPDQFGQDNVPVPTLKEVIEYVKKIAGNKVGFQIEIKNDPSKPENSASPKEYAKALSKILVKEKVIDRTEVQALDWRYLLELQDLNKNIKTAYLTEIQAKKMTDEYAYLWTAGYKPKDFNYSYPQLIKHLGGACWEPYEKNLTKKDLKEAHASGIKVVTWGWPEKNKTEFDSKKIAKLIKWKVDGIITDRPDMLRGMLAARNYNLPTGFCIK